MPLLTGLRLPCATGRYREILDFALEIGGIAGPNAFQITYLRDQFPT